MHVCYMHELAIYWKCRNTLATHHGARPKCSGSRGGWIEGWDASSPPFEEGKSTIPMNREGVRGSLIGILFSNVLLANVLLVEILLADILSEDV